MIHCMIKSCKISGQIPGITYHMIPFKHAKQWFPDLQGTVGQIIADHIVVCSMHFTPGDFMKKSQVKTEPAIESSSRNNLGNNITLVQLQMQPVLVLQPIIPPPKDYVYVLPDEKLKQIINGESSCFPSANFVERTNSSTFKENIKIDPLLYSNIQQETIKEEIISDNSVDFTNDDFLDRTQNAKNVNTEFNTYSKRETIEEQNRIIRDIHNYSVTPGKEEWLATRNVIRTIKKDIKCAQQKNRRLETRFIRLKKEYQELKYKKK